jgi:hypothetical protein
VLLQALINNGGLLKSLPVDQLAMFSWGIFESHPAWKHDLPDHLRDRKHWKNDNSWIQYWKKNPVKAWSSGNFFDIDPEQRFILCQKLNEEHCDALEYMMREIIDYRQEQYWQRGVAQSIKPIPETQAVSQASEQQ